MSADVLRDIAARFRVQLSTVRRWKREASTAAWAALVAAHTALAQDLPDRSYFQDVRNVRTALLRAKATDPALRDLLALGTTKTLRPDTIVHVYMAIRERPWLSWMGLKSLSVNAGHHPTTVLHSVKVLQYLDVVGRFGRWREQDRVRCPEDPDQDARYRTNVYVPIPLPAAGTWPTADALVGEGSWELSDDELEQLAQLEELPAMPNAAEPANERVEERELLEPALEGEPIEPVRVPARSSSASPTEHNAALAALRRHAALAPLATEETAEKITKASRTVGKLHLLEKALAECAAKIVAGLYPCTLAVVVTFVTDVREQRGFLPPQPPPEPVLEETIEEQTARILAEAEERDRRADLNAEAQLRAADAARLPLGPRQIEGRAVPAELAALNAVLDSQGPPRLPAPAHAALAEKADAVDGSPSSARE